MIRQTWALLTLAVAGCASLGPIQYPTTSFSSADHSRKVESFLIIVDDSGSMSSATRQISADGTAMNRPKIEVATQLANSLSGSIPAVGLRGAVRSFGQGSCLPKDETSLLSPMGTFDAAKAAEGIGKIVCVGGESPLDSALTAAAADLSGARGAAVFVITDGLRMGNDELAAAVALHEATDACVYAIQVGHAQEGRLFLRRLVEVTGCGELLEADDLADEARLRALLSNALLAPTSDRDGDGVADSDDRCPNTARGVAVDAHGCPKDSDGDGVADDQDQCPGTPAGAPVDDQGCPVKGIEVTDEGWRMSGEVLFASNRAELQEAAKSILQGLAQHMNRTPQLRFRIEGHTDDRGTEEYNQQLSERRAQSTKDYLVSLGVAADRLTVQGMGESSPLVPNDSAENRQKNRRVEFRPL